MAINLIIIAVTLLMGSFVGVWLACPRCRPWFEAPRWNRSAGTNGPVRMPDLAELQAAYAGRTHCTVSQLTEILATPNS